MRKAQLNEAGKVENIIVVKDDAFSIPGKTLVDEGPNCTIGATYADGVFTPPPPPPVPPAPEPDPQQVLLRAIEKKLNLTQADIDAARLELKDAQVGQK